MIRVRPTDYLGILALAIAILLLCPPGTADGELPDPEPGICNRYQPGHTPVPNWCPTPYCGLFNDPCPEDDHDCRQMNYTAATCPGDEGPCT
jgi:hypothetical protein